MLTVILLILFQVKHYICDFPLQTERHLKKFSTNRRTQAIALADHSLVHAVGTVIVSSPLLLFYQSPLVFAPLVIAAIDFISHFIVDYWKVEASRPYTTDDSTFWDLLGKDQMFHQLTYIGLAVLYSIILIGV